jgi:tRNA (guanine37-N1)-methyltransferase
MLDTTPPIHREMRDALDRSAFKKSIPVLAARVKPSETNKILKAPVLKNLILDLPKIRTVIRDPTASSDTNLVLLWTNNEAELTPDARQFLESQSQGIVSHNVELDYSYWTADEILQSILPEEICETSPTSFTITGHLAHMNLRDEYLPYRKVIGQVILDKNRGLRTVVNKLETIDSQFRFFKMEVLAGDEDFVVEAHESDCKFTFDFSTVYWNSRLHTEHERLVKLFEEDDVIADVFAGVGPFAIPAAKKGCVVLGNDLNPKSAEYMEKNAHDNHVAERVRVSNLDGREFIRNSIAEIWNNPFPPLGPVQSAKSRARQQRAARTKGRQSPSGNAEPQYPTRRRIDHFVMNLPATAIEFLDSFQGILAPLPEAVTAYDLMPMVHVHCFTREPEGEGARADLRQRAETALGASLPDDTVFHFVRAVAPNKDMYCLSFRLPRDHLMSTS